MAIKIEAQTVVTITSGGTARPLSSFPLPCTSVIVQAEYTNIGRISIAGAEVTTSNGIEIGPGDTFSLNIESISRIGEFDLADIYVVSATTGDKVRVLAFRRK